MSGSSITCLQCGQTNPIHRLWCEKCGKRIPYQSKPPRVIEDPSAAERSQLYVRVLADLQGLFTDGKVSSDTYDAIHTFYEHQLAQLDEQIAERTRARKLHQLVTTARQAAQSGRFQDAIGLLQQGLAVDRGEHQLEQVIAEVNEKREQRERELRASREADALLRESIASIADFRLEEAEDKLEQARRLDPNNNRIITALQRVKTQIADGHARKLAQQTRSVDDQEQVLVAELVEKPEEPAVVLAAAPVQQAAAESPPEPHPIAHAEPSFAEEQQQVPSPKHRLIEAASQWSSIVKPFLLDNVGWFVGAFLVVAGFVVLIVTFWGTIEEDPILMHSLVYLSLAVATGMFFAAAYFMRLKYPQLESSSNALLVIVALLIPLVFAAALLTSLIPAAVVDVALLQNPG
jgi:tetratricopeptide (TPR) repeat protein